MNKKISILCIVMFFSIFPLMLWAQQDPVQSSKPEQIKSLGLPSRWEFSWGPMFVIDDQGDETKYGGQIYGRLYRHLGHPSFGIGLIGEGYGQGIDDQADGGVRLLGEIKLLFLEAGADYSFEQERTDLILSLLFPLRRGGLFGRGGKFRVDWLPARNTFNLGFRIPIGQPYLGKTRVKSDQVALPRASAPTLSRHAGEISPELEDTLQHLERAAFWINISTTPFFDQKESLGEKRLQEFYQNKISSFEDHLNLIDELYPEGHTVEAELEVYHDMFDHAFVLALGDGPDAGLQIAEKAREILLHDVILPYNRLLGRSKSGDSLWGYIAVARRHFDEWLHEQKNLSESQQNTLRSVFLRTLNMVEENRRNSRALWGSSEFVWIPLPYGLQPEQYDTQKKLNTILELVTGDTFSDANEVYYVINEQFQTELARMIHEAEDYHVLWIHDYSGINHAGNPDRIGFRQTVESYFGALIKSVHAYDATGKMPVYMMFIDQFFYEPRKGKLWLKLLQNPLEHRVHLPADYKEWEQKIRTAQEELRQAVADSKLLREQTHLYGKKWLKNTIKVHVNVTNPSDYSFRTSHLVPKMPFAPDDLMRDHRKISFYDITERDPGKGEVLFTGMGVGEHYAGPTWEDRAILFRGPATLSVKHEARQLLLQQNFKEDEIPLPLRKLPKPSNYDQMVEALKAQGWETTLMEVQNQTGFRPKPINALKATLYSLMPKGSTIIIPDSLWNAPFWAGMLAGAAIRGCKVLVIAPALDNAPSAGFPQMSRAQELFSRLIIIQNELQDELKAVGGMLKVGIYNRKTPIGSFEGFNEFFNGVETYPFLKEIFPFQPDVYARLEEIIKGVHAEGWQPTYYTEDIEERLPKLHLKINAFTSDEFQQFVAQPGWADVLEAYAKYRLKFLTRGQDELVEVKDVPAELRETFNRLFWPYVNSLPEEALQRAISYLIVGSQNQDYRGMIMDAEAACVVSGYDSVIAMFDLFFMTGVTTWVDDVETLNTLLPPYTGWRKRFGRYIMKAL